MSILNWYTRSPTFEEGCAGNKHTTIHCCSRDESIKNVKVELPQICFEMHSQVRARHTHESNDETTRKMLAEVEASTCHQRAVDHHVTDAAEQLYSRVTHKHEAFSWTAFLAQNGRKFSKVMTMLIPKPSW